MNDLIQEFLEREQTYKMELRRIETQIADLVIQRDALSKILATMQEVTNTKPIRAIVDPSKPSRWSSDYLLTKAIEVVLKEYPDWNEVFEEITKPENKDQLETTAKRRKLLEQIANQLEQEQFPFKDAPKRSVNIALKHVASQRKKRREDLENQAINKQDRLPLES